MSTKCWMKKILSDIFHMSIIESNPQTLLIHILCQLWAFLCVYLLTTPDNIIDKCFQFFS